MSAVFPSIFYTHPHQDGEYLATSCDDCVCLWSVSDGTLYRVLPSAATSIYACAFRANGDLVTTGQLIKSPKPRSKPRSNSNKAASAKRFDWLK